MIRRRKRIRKEELYGNMKLLIFLLIVYVYLLFIKVLCIYVNFEKKEKFNLEEIFR